MSAAPPSPILLALTAVLRLREMNRRDEAEHVCRQVLRVAPKHRDALVLMGGLARERGNPDEAAGWFEQALAQVPDQPEIRFKLALSLEESGQSEAADLHCQRTLTYDPGHIGALTMRGTLAARRRDHATAVAMLGAALRHQPDFMPARFALANTLREKGDSEAAIEAYREILRTHPDHCGALINQGVAWRDLGRLDQAEACARAALAHYPDSAEAHFNLSQALLLKGDFAAGWPEYEWRLRAGPVEKRRAPFAVPRWRGEALAGRTLLVHAEQGMGDLIQVLRFIPRMAAAGGRIVIEAPAGLIRLCAAMAGIDQVVRRGDPMPAFDCEIPAMSLPGLFVASAADLPGQVPYLAPDPDERARWARRLGGPGLAVGVCWAGSPTHVADRARSLLAETVVPALPRPGLRLYSLQKEIRPHDRPVLDRLAPALTDLSAHLTDGAATLAILSGLDLIISADTAVAHLAGALGKPVWLLVPHAPDWRWQLDRTDSPWYPSMTLWRQPRRDDWAPVVAAVSQALDRLAGAHH